jgi:predicted RNA-binding protein YlxR (DUF448 family)
VGRGGRTNRTEVVERRCIATKQTLPTSDLIRFVLDPNDVVTPDISERLPGRGMWVCANRADLDKAIDQNLFSKSAKQQAIIPEGLADLVETLIIKRAIDLLSMARKSGHAICGFEKTKSAMMSERWYILMQAEDGSTPQKQKIRPSAVDNSYISCFTAQELGLAFGRENVIHAAVSKGGLSARILLEANRLAGFRKKRDASPYKIADPKSAANG